MKTVHALLALALASATLSAQAEEAAASPLSFNLGLAGEYRHRGIAQSHLQSALQGGVSPEALQSPGRTALLVSVEKTF